MLNALVLYNLAMSAFLVWWHHGRPIQAQPVHGIIFGFLSFTGRTIGLGWRLVPFLFIGYTRGGWVGPGYAEWVYAYTANHSTALWGVTTPVITVALWVLWKSTFVVAKNPVGMGWTTGEARPHPRISMRLPAIWGAVFYAWLLFSPTLPFYDCIVKHLIMHVPVESLQQWP